MNTHVPDTMDVAVVGAGPAGAVAAMCIARTGVSVALLDRAVFPRYKVCGCCLNEGALSELAAAGFPSRNLDEAAHLLQSFSIHAGGKSLTLPLRPGLAVSRSVLDAKLVEAAQQSGASFFGSVSARVAQTNHECIVLALTQGTSQHTLRARVVVVADGLSGTTLTNSGHWQWIVRSRSRLGLGVVLPWNAQLEKTIQPHTIHMAWAPFGYMGIVRHGESTFDLAAAVDAAALHQAGSAEACLAAVGAEAGLFIDSSLRTLRIHGTSTLTRRRLHCEADRIFVIGDAASYIEPFTGEGMSWAISSGRAIAEHVSATLAGTRKPGSWTFHRCRLLGARQRKCGIIAGTLRSPAAYKSVRGCMAVAALPGCKFIISRMLGVASRSFGPAWTT